MGKWINPSGTKTYRAWAAMRNRCYQPSNPVWKYYGARWITVCDQWRNDYDQFFEDMGGVPSRTNTGANK